MLVTKGTRAPTANTAIHPNVERLTRYTPLTDLNGVRKKAQCAPGETQGTLYYQLAGLLVEPLEPQAGSTVSIVLLLVQEESCSPHHFRTKILCLFDPSSLVIRQLSVSDVGA